MPVSDADLPAFASSHDIIALGMAADDVRRRLHGGRTTFVRVADVDGAVGAPLDVPAAAGEIRIAGAAASRPLMIQRIGEVAAAAAGRPISGYSLSDLEAMALGEHITLRALLEELEAAGLELVSEARFDLLRDPRRSVEEVNIAGLRLARLTVHQLPAEDPASFYRRIGALQYNVAVIRAFAPLPRTVNPAVPTTGYDDLRRIALARLLLDEIPSIQVDWALYGPKLAQVALTCGADDLDAVSANDDLTDGRRRAPLEEVRRNIQAAGFEAVQRNGRFDVIA